MTPNTQQTMGENGFGVVEKARRGFSAMPEKTQRSLASAGGKTVAQQRGPDYMRQLGSKGGKKSHAGDAERAAAATPPQIAVAPSLAEVAMDVEMLSDVLTMIQTNLECAQRMVNRAKQSRRQG